MWCVASITNNLERERDRERDTHRSPLPTVSVLLVFSPFGTDYTMAADFDRTFVSTID